MHISEEHYFSWTTDLHFEKINLFQNLQDSHSCLNLQVFKDNVFEHITERI